MANVIIAIFFGLLAIIMLKAFIRDLWAMHKAPRGRKIEAYYTSAKGYNPFTGEAGRKLK